MSENSLPALVATDLRKDVQMTSPGTGSLPLQGVGLTNLGQMIDGQILQLEKLKTVAMEMEQDSKEQVLVLKEEARLLRMKLSQKEKEIAELRQAAQGNLQNGPMSSATNGSSGEGSTEHWKMRYEKVEKQCEDLRQELNLARACSACSAQTPSHNAAVQRSVSQPMLIGNTSQNAVETCIFTDEHRDYLVDKISMNDIKVVMRKLLQENEIQNVLYKFKNEPMEHSVQYIMFWQKKEGRKATVWAMVKALLDCKQRSIAEQICDKFGCGALLEKMDELDAQTRHNDSSSSLNSQGRDSLGGEDIADFNPTSPAEAACPASPPVCPSDASPLQRVVWPYLLDPASAADLKHELGEAEPWSDKHRSKFGKRMFDGAKERERFNEAAKGGNPEAILEAWADVELSLLKDQPEVPRPVLRKLGKTLRTLGMDVRQVIVTHLHSGLLGPYLDEKTLLRDKNSVTFNSFQKIARQFSETQPGKRDWRNFASSVGFSDFITRWESQAHHTLPGENMLRSWETKKDSTIGYLYQWALDSNRTDITELLEKDFSKPIIYV